MQVPVLHSDSSVCLPPLYRCLRVNKPVTSDEVSELTVADPLTAELRCVERLWVGRLDPWRDHRPKPVEDTDGLFV